jgi:hypothetical protein
MKTTQQEREILRDLALRYREIATAPEQTERKARMKATNDLQQVRPTVLLDEIPWNELNATGELTLLCSDPEARAMETYFRRALYRAKYFPADTIFEPLYPLTMSVRGWGEEPRVKEDLKVFDQANNIVSHGYHDILEDEESLKAFTMPALTRDREDEARRVAEAEEVLTGILPVALRGWGIYFAPWDRIPRYHGVENSFVDLYDRPEFMHAVMDWLVKREEAKLEQLEALGGLEPRDPLLHCTPAYATGIPDASEEGPFKLDQMWFRSMAQMFTNVSPEMHLEFDLAHTLPLMKRCKYTYYGCCEALDQKIDLLRTHIPNLRKVGCSPWADPDSIAEQLGRDFVMACKPNPAFVATKTDPEVVRKEIARCCEAALRTGSPVEFVLKDISTVGYDPQNLVLWEQTAMETVRKYFG